MVKLDWKKITSRPPEDFSEEEKDDLFNSVAWYIPEPHLDVERLKVLFKTAQAILKYKGEQVESLVVELDELAARQGAEEAQRHQNLIEEVDEMRMLLSQSQKKGTSSKKDSEIESLKQELVQCEANNEQLRTELKAREKDLLVEKREVEKLAAQLMTLESEKTELRRELAAIQVETSSHHEFMHQEDSAGPTEEKQRELVESLRQKNKHISQLLSDVEVVERENLILRRKLSSLRDELSEATKHLTHMTGELTGLKHTCNEQEEKINVVEEQNTALRLQVKELVDQKFYRDIQLDDFSEALDSRVHNWQQLTEEKDAEIEELKARLSHLAAQAPNIQIDTERCRVALLMQTLQNREEQIETLQKQLTEATKEIHNSATLLEQLKSKKSKHRTVDINAKLQSQLQQAESQVEFLEIKLKDAEDDAQVKAEEMSSMIIQLRDYESGEYGLMEAVGEIKDLRQQRRVRDKQIEELVQATNVLQAEAGHLEEQNIALREKLGLPPDAPVSVNGVLSQRHKEQALMRLLQQQAERLEEEKLQLKLDSRRLIQQVSKLSTQVKSLGYQPNLSVTNEANSDSIVQKQDSVEVVPYVDREEVQNGVAKEELEMRNQQVKRLEEKLQDATKENESLRKGMHEILDSIHNQDGSSAVQLESQCLERLLEALDSRHISGWYHPAMRLQSQLSALEGSNAVLREQLRDARMEEKKASQLLQKATLKIEQLEHSLEPLQEGQKINIPQNSMCHDKMLPPNMSLSSAEIIDKLNRHLLHVLNEYNNEADKNKSLVKSVQDLDKKFNILRHQMGLLYKEYNAEKSEWSKIEDKLKSEKEHLRETSECLQAKVQEFESHWNVLNKDDSEQKRLLSESAQRTALLKANEIVSTRKCQTLQNLENQLRRENAHMAETISEIECTVTQRIGELNRHKEMSSFRITSLQKMLEDSVPLTTLEAANKQYNELTSKYRDLLQKEQRIVCEGQLSARLEGEVDILRKDKVELSNALQAARQKLHSLEVLVTSLNQDTVTQDTHDNQISILTKKLATLELRELNEKQRADHADKMYKIMKGQLTQLEERNAEVEVQYKTVLQQNLELQQLERDLRDQLLTVASREEFQQLKEKLHSSEAQKLELKLEREKLQEVADIAQEQVRTLELWKTSKDCELYSLRALVLELQSTSEEKATIARLSHELLSVRLIEASTNKKVQQLKNEIIKWQTYSLRQEGKLDEKERDLNHIRNQFTNRCRSLHQMIQSLRRQYSGAVPLAKLEWFSVSLCRLEEERQEARLRLREAENTAHSAKLNNEKLELELQSLKELKQLLLPAESKQVIDWHSKNTELRLTELKSRNKAEFFEQQLDKAEERLKKQESHIASLEQEQIQEQKNLEQTMIQWEHTQAELYKQLEEYENRQKTTDVVQSCSVAAENGQTQSDLNRALGLVSSQSQSLLKCEAELAQLRSKVMSLSQLLEEKEKLILAKEKINADLRVHLESTPKVSTQDLIPPQIILEPIDSAEKLALKATVESLESIVSQKEETISRYQLMMKEARDEHSRAAAECQEELRSLHATMANQQQAYSRLKSKLRQPGPAPKHTMTAVEQYIVRMHELEDEVGELNTTVSNLSNRLHSCREEADRWRTLADDRLRNMGELRQRLEDQHYTELQNYRESAQRYQDDAEAAIQEANQAQEELRQYKSQKAPLLSSTTLKIQLQEKEEKIRTLSQTVSDLKRELSLSTTSRMETNGRQSIERAKSTDDLHKLKKQLESTNAELKSAKGNIHQLQLKSRDVWIRKKEELRAGREEMLLKKIKTMEREFKEEKESIEMEIANNEAKKIKSAEEVARWNEKKRWQQTVEKLKEKIKEKSHEEEKLLKVDRQLRDTISRLEREKIVLYSRSNKGTEVMGSRIEVLEVENAKLQTEVNSLKSKVEMQKHHSGGLGATMLEERLEAQQRRIAVLELAKKGDGIVAEELERLQEGNAVLQKANLRLESENLELQLDLQKIRTDTPRLKEKVSHLENYITLLKAENIPGSSESEEVKETSGKKSFAELEKTIIALKKVLVKLQKENKRLLEIKRDNTNTKDRRPSVDHSKAGLQALEEEKKKLQEHYLDALERETQLEGQVVKLRANISTLEGKLLSAANESEVLKTQLVQKTQLLDRVKVLLQRAAAKEKLLQDQVTALQSLMPAGTFHP